MKCRCFRNIFKVFNILSHYSIKFAFNLMQIKTTLRCYLTIVRMANIKNTNGDKRWQRRGEIRLINCL